MNKRRTIKPKITDHDRFGMTFFLATIFHGMVILGITFSVSPPADSKTSPALDIILVQTKSPSESDDADYLAQVSQQGGGNAEQKARPTELFSAPTLSSTPGLAMESSVQQVQQQKQNEQVAMLTQDDADYSINTEENPAKADDNTTINQSTVNKNTQAARLAAEISNTIEEQASIERTKYLNSSTREFAPRNICASG